MFSIRSHIAYTMATRRVFDLLNGGNRDGRSIFPPLLRSLMRLGAAVTDREPRDRSVIRRCLLAGLSLFSRCFSGRPVTGRQAESRRCGIESQRFDDKTAGVGRSLRPRTVTVHMVRHPREAGAEAADHRFQRRVELAVVGVGGMEPLA